jgi:hypothetical protein
MAAIQHGIAQAGTMKPITRKGHKERARRQNQGAIKSKVQLNLKSKVMETNVTQFWIITQIRILGVQRHPPVSVLFKVRDNASTRTNVMWRMPASSTTETIMVWAGQGTRRANHTATQAQSTLKADAPETAGGHPSSKNNRQNQWGRRPQRHGGSNGARGIPFDKVGVKLNQIGVVRHPPVCVQGAASGINLTGQG